MLSAPTNTNTNANTTTSLSTISSAETYYASVLSSTLPASISTLSSYVPANTTVIQPESTTLLTNSNQAASSTTATTLGNTPQTAIVSNGSGASTSPAVYGSVSPSAKSISDAITGFANKFAIMGIAALVLGLGCAFVVYRRVNSEDEG